MKYFSSTVYNSRPKSQQMSEDDIAFFPRLFQISPGDSQIDNVEVHLQGGRSFVHFLVFRGATMPTYVHRCEMGALALVAGGLLCTRGMGQVAWEPFRPP